MELLSIPQLIAYASTVAPLRAGDVIVTGTPGGVGAKRPPPRWMKDGDVVGVERVGVLRNPVTDEAARLTMKPLVWIVLAMAIATALAAGAAAAEVTLGIVLSTTGPAPLGILEKNGVNVAVPGSKEKYKVAFLDDATDPAEATRPTRKLIAEDKVDANIGTTGSPAAPAMIGVVGEGATPTISMASSNALVIPVDGPRHWVFKTTTNDDHEVNPLLSHMKAQGVQSLGFIGFSDS